MKLIFSTFSFWYYFNIGFYIVLILILFHHYKVWQFGNSLRPYIDGTASFPVYDIRASSPPFRYSYCSLPLVFDVFSVVMFWIRKSCERFAVFASRQNKRSAPTSLIGETIFFSPKVLKKQTSRKSISLDRNDGQRLFALDLARRCFSPSREPPVTRPRHYDGYRLSLKYPGAARTVTRPIRRTCVEPITRRACRTRRLWYVFPRTFIFCITATRNTSSSSGVRPRATAARLRVARIVCGTYQ